MESDGCNLSCLVAIGNDTPTFFKSKLSNRKKVIVFSQRQQLLNNFSFNGNALVRPGNIIPAVNPVSTIIKGVLTLHAYCCFILFREQGFLRTFR